MRRIVRAIAIVLAGTAAAVACQAACDREGCEEGARPVDDASIEQGIAGVAFSESDVVANGCQECTLSQGTIHVWAAAGPIESEADAAAVLAGGEPEHTVSIDERYELALEPGHWLVCVGSEDEARTCAALALARGDVFTVHARFVFGPASLVVFEPGEDDPRDDAELFEVSP